jgi:chromate transporter
MSSRHLKAAVDGVTAAATGAIAGAVVVLGRRAIIDAQTIGIAVVTLLVLIRARRLPEPLIIVAAGMAGIVLMRLR